MGSELLPCPFCGGQVEAYTDPYGDGKEEIWFAECVNTNDEGHPFWMTGPHKTREAAVVEANRRPGSTPVQPGKEGGRNA